MYIATMEGIYDHGVIAWDTDLAELKKKVVAFQNEPKGDDYHEYRIEHLGAEEYPQYIGRFLKVKQTAIKPKHGWTHMGKYGEGTWVFVWEQFPDHVETLDET
jgi:hypothetical protein